MGARDRTGRGLDVHKKTVAVCVRVPAPDGSRVQHVRTFGRRPLTFSPYAIGWKPTG